MSKKGRIIQFLLGIALCFGFKTFAQPPYSQPGEQIAVPLDMTDAPFGYYEYLPEDFISSPGKVFPIVFFFHGSGERGNGTSELVKLLTHGPPKLIQSGKDYPAIIISLQAPGGFMSSADFLTIYNYFSQHYPVDLNRVYVTGLSAGGGGTWNALKAHYEKIAAAIPICGAGVVPDPASFLLNTPIWAFHNFNDGTVPISNTYHNLDRIAKNGGSVMDVYPYGDNKTVADGTYTMKYDSVEKRWNAVKGVVRPVDSNLAFTLYPNGGHDSWTKTYENKEVWDWLFSQSFKVNTGGKENLVLSRIFPNPTSGLITINSPNASEKSIEIFNVTGRRLFRGELSENQHPDLGIYGKGLYFIRLKSVRINETLKVIVE